jgi:hypothetical protein
MSGETVYLLEAQPLNTSGVAENVFFSDGLLTEADFQSTGNKYPVRLSQAFTHETSIFEENVPGQTSVSLGSATINNVDGRFDYLLDYAWDARPLTIKRGKLGSSYTSFVTEFVGSTTEITTDTNSLTLTLRDNSYKLTKPVQNNKYAGTGGAEGGIDLQNKFKPLLFGKARNLSPVWVDQALLTGQIHDGVLSSVDAVYDRANAIKFQQDYASYASLIAATIPPGYYGTCKASGFIRLGAPPAGTITVDAVGAFGTVTNIPELAKQLLTSRLGLSSGELDVSAFTQASTDAPWAFEGLYFPEPELQYDELMETLASAVFGFWYVTRSGLISFKIFKFSTPVATIRQEDLMSLGKAPSPVPLFRVKVDYAQNPTVQPPSDFTIPKQLLNAYLDKMYLYVDTSVATPDYSGAGKYHVFLNNTEVNDLGIATFRVPNGESWIAIDQSGNITVTAPPSSPASAVLRVNIGEFAWDEVFTVVKDAVSPLNKIDLSLSADRFYFDDNGQPSPAGQSVVATATGTNTTAPITITAVDNLGNNVTITGGNTIPIANVSSSVLVQWIEVKATDANGIQQRKRLVVQHGNDAYAQGILGSYSSSGATFFFQTAAPTSGMQTNDVWVDTDDANKTYRWTGSTWAAFSDTRIVDALTAAAGAQATADGKIKTYVSTTTPSGTFAVGDLWYNPTTQALLRWNGSSWGDTVSTVGAQVGVNLTNGGSVVVSSTIVNSAITINPDGSLSGAGGGSATLGGMGYTGLWSGIGTTFSLSGNTLSKPAGSGDAYAGGVVGRVITGPQTVSCTPYNVNGKSTILALDDDATNFTLATMLYAVVYTYSSTLNQQVQIYKNGVSVAGPVGFGIGTTPQNLSLVYDEIGIRVYTDGVFRTQYISGVLPAQSFYPKALLLNAGASYTNLTYSQSTTQPTLGSTVQNSSGSVVTDTQVLNSAVSISSAGVLSGAGGGTVTYSGLGGGAVGTQSTLLLGGTYLRDSGNTVLSDSTVKNSAISISSAGVLSGAGGGSVTIGGLGFQGDLFATRNRTLYSPTDPGAVEDGYIWGDTSSALLAHKVRIGGVWRTLSSYGARAGTNLYDSFLSALSDANVKNSAVSISAGGVLSGAGGGTVTIGGLGGGPFATDPRTPENVFTGSANLLFNGSLKLRDASNKALGFSWPVGFAFSGIGSIAPYVYISGPQTGLTAAALSDVIPVLPSSSYQLQGEVHAAGATSGMVGFDVIWYSDAAGTVFLSNDANMSATIGASWTRYTQAYTSPSGALSARIRPKVGSVNITSGQVIGWRRIKFASNAVISGDTPFTDEATLSSLLLSTPGTGVRVGDQRQLPQIASQNLRYKNTGAVSYTAAAGSPATATITIGASTSYIGSISIAYNSMSVGVTGTGNTTINYYLYVDDPNYAGGTPSGGLKATTDTSLIYQSDARVYLGNCSVFFPSSGTGGGGGIGGGGGCVHEDSWVETQEGLKRAKDVVAGDYVLSLGEDRNSAKSWTEVLGNSTQIEYGYEIITANGCVLLLSQSTPLTLRNGDTIYPADLKDHELPTLVEGDFEWSVARASEAGNIPVCYIRAGGATFAAGRKAGKLILTHNVDKP